MSELISGKEAKLAWANGEKVEYYKKDRDEWFEVRGNTYVSVFDIVDKFRIKQRTITINGIEVPAPFKPKKGDTYYRINPSDIGGLYYKEHSFSEDPFDRSCAEFGVWRTEEEIKQVIAALRNIFGAKP